MTITFPPMVKIGGARNKEPPRALREHRAGKFFLYDDLPGEVIRAIARRVLSVRAIAHDGYTEIHCWCEDFDSIVAGQELPHYRWMYDTDTFELSCVKESAVTETPRESAPASPLVPESGGHDLEPDHELPQEDPARLDP